MFHLSWYCVSNHLVWFLFSQFGGSNPWIQGRDQFADRPSFFCGLARRQHKFLARKCLIKSCPLHHNWVVYCQQSRARHRRQHQQFLLHKSIWLQQDIKVIRCNIHTYIWLAWKSGLQERSLDYNRLSQDYSLVSITDQVRTYSTGANRKSILPFPT